MASKISCHGRVGSTLNKISYNTHCVCAGCVVPGAGAFEVAAHAELMKFKDTVKGRARLGVQVRT